MSTAKMDLSPECACESHRTKSLSAPFSFSIKSSHSLQFDLIMPFLLWVLSRWCLILLTFALWLNFCKEKSKVWLLQERIITTLALIHQNPMSKFIKSHLKLTRKIWVLDSKLRYYVDPKCVRVSNRKVLICTVIANIHNSQGIWRTQNFVLKSMFNSKF